MDEELIQRMFYHPVCNGSEVDRVLNVKTASDYLLKLRADTIVDHMRLFRLYRNYVSLTEGAGKKWSLEKSFKTAHYEQFFKNIDPDLRSQFYGATFGDFFSYEPSASIHTSDFGPIVTVSRSFEFFLKFYHLAVLDFETDVPADVRLNALRISMRVLLQR